MLLNYVLKHTFSIICLFFHKLQQKIILFSANLNLDQVKVVRHNSHIANFAQGLPLDTNTSNRSSNVGIGTVVSEKSRNLQDRRRTQRQKRAIVRRRL